MLRAYHNSSVPVLIDMDEAHTDVSFIFLMFLNCTINCSLDLMCHLLEIPLTASIKYKTCFCNVTVTHVFSQIDILIYSWVARA